MKKRNVLVLMLTLLMIGWFSSLALAAGPEDPGGCDAEYIEDPDDPIYDCEFTVTRDKSSCSAACIAAGLLPHYNIVFKCKVKKVGKHLFSFPNDVSSWLNLEEVDDDGEYVWDEERLLDPTWGFSYYPCQLQVEEAFGDTGLPVVQELKITDRGNGNTPDEWMLGKFKVRVVQPISSP